MRKTTRCIIAIAIAIAITAVLSGCKTAKDNVIYETIVRTDTIIIRDTVHITDLNNVRDSVVEKVVIHRRDSIVMWMSENGDVVSKEKYSDTDRDSILAAWHDTERDYEKLTSMVDSLISASVGSTVETVEVQAPLTWWQKTTGFIGTVILIAGGIVLLVLAVRGIIAAIRRNSS